MAHAIVDPGAVMVHSQHAALAYAAMVAARRLGLPTLLAKPLSTTLYMIERLLAAY